MNPKVDFMEDNESERVPPKIQGVRVIVDATQMNGIEKRRFLRDNKGLLRLIFVEFLCSVCLLELFILIV